MAKGKKGGKRRISGHRRRRRMGAAHTRLAEIGLLVLGAGVGAISGVFVNQAIKSSFTSMPSWIGGGACVALGAGVAVFGGDTPLMLGIGAGLMGVGAVFATNETFLSLPGISGVPTGLPNAMPGGGYMRQTVGKRRMGNYKGIPPSMVGNLSGENGKVIGAIYRN